MLGLRVRLKGRPQVAVALSPEIRVATAGLEWRCRSRSGAANPCGHVTGLDDRDDHLVWMKVGAVSRGSWMEIEVGEVGAIHPPRREPRKRVDWAAMFARMRGRDDRRLGILVERLRRLRAGRPYEVKLVAPGPPVVGLAVSVNGCGLGRFGVGKPGAIGIDVVGRRVGGRSAFCLCLHGGELVGGASWCWYEWGWTRRRLRAGDRVRIEVVSPRRLDQPKARRLKTYEPRTASEIHGEITALRKETGSSPEPAAIG